MLSGKQTDRQKSSKVVAFAQAASWVLAENEFKAELSTTIGENTSLAEKGHSLTACNATAPAKSKMPPFGPKMADGVWKGVYP